MSVLCLLQPQNLVIVLWVVYWISSVTLAVTIRMGVKKVARGESFVDRVLQNILMVVALYLIYSPYLFFLSHRVILASNWVMIIGCCMVAGALAFAVWAMITMRGNWSSAVQSVQRQELVKTGPFTYVRHPIYAGVTGAFLGTMLVQGSLASLVALVCIIIKYVLKIKHEEQFLLQLFGQQYADYQRKTWKMIPFIY
jgi:protein-S-isoprenylcysteine O-methyltransferase Ste14